MTNPADRRGDEPELSEAFSPEYLAMLVVCGGTVRDSDWNLLPATVAARRPRASAEVPEEATAETADAGAAAPPDGKPPR